MGKREDQRIAVQKRLASYVLEHGLGQTSLRQLALAAEISDRMLLYYFRNKDDVLQAVLGQLAGELALLLAAALPPEERVSPAELYTRTASLAASPALRPYMEIWGEMAAAAARKEQPFAAITDGIAQGFQLWIESRLAIEDEEERRAMASLLMVMVDGGALLEALDGGRITARARTAMAALLAGA